jgi:hypothetical protein
MDDLRAENERLRELAKAHWDKFGRVRREAERLRDDRDVARRQVELVKREVERLRRELRDREQSFADVCANEDRLEDEVERWRRFSEALTGPVAVEAAVDALLTGPWAAVQSISPDTTRSWLEVVLAAAVEAAKKEAGRDGI